jgi:hypothetical protein
MSSSNAPVSTRQPSTAVYQLLTPIDGAENTFHWHGVAPSVAAVYKMNQASHPAAQRA